MVTKPPSFNIYKEQRLKIFDAIYACENNIKLLIATKNKDLYVKVY